jgi:AraC-like DNA-binding protein
MAPPSQMAALKKPEDALPGCRVLSWMSAILAGLIGCIVGFGPIEAATAVGGNALTGQLAGASAVPLKAHGGNSPPARQGQQQGPNEDPRPAQPTTPVSQPGAKAGRRKGQSDEAGVESCQTSLRIDAAARPGLSGRPDSRAQAPEPSNYPPNRRRRKPSHPQSAPQDGSGVLRSRLNLVADWVAEARRAQYQATKLAVLCDVSDRTLRRFFSQSTGLSTQRWLDQLRLLDSLPLLSKGYLIKAVASDLGFCSPSHFASRFRACFGCAPTDLVVDRFGMRAWLDEHRSTDAPGFPGPSASLAQLKKNYMELMRRRLDRPPGLARH